jgi:hypothetical protein
LTSESITFQVESREANRRSALAHYLLEDAKRTKKFIPGSQANSDIDNFQASLLSLSKRLEEYLEGDTYQRAILVLGKIQSGKTSHLLGTLAWCIDSDFGLATIFTGITGELNQQTNVRLSESLKELGNDFISIHEVPTNSDSNEYQHLKDSLVSEIRERQNSSIRSPLPILITMKNRYRLQTLETLYKDLLTEIELTPKVLIIDDEADQASQNSKASTSKTTTTYDALVRVRNSGLPNFLLSYTATPQAVLLTEKLGKLRPNECVVAPPRYGYFGLQHICDPSYSKQLIEVDDWPASKEKISTCPASLKNALLDFFLITYIRNKFPEIFFEESGVINNEHLTANKSLQMMVHEAVEVAKHRDVYRLINNERVEILEILREYIRGELPKSVHEDLLSTLYTAWQELVSRLNKDVVDRIHFNSENFSDLLDVIEDSEVVVVNADKKRPNIDVRFPSTKEAWNEHKAWVLIGGDILGRGLTIPQLVTTYFLRSSKRPNFDTVSQQMRFCGYRSSYKAFTSIWAPNSTFLTFRYMDKVETVMWNRVCGWDAERLDLSKEFPRVIYAAPLNVNMEPTRKSVRDPNLLDKKVNGEIIFTSRKVMDPNRVAENLNLITRWAKSAGEFNKLGSDWLQVDEPDNKSVKRLLTKWSVAPSEHYELSATAELFEDDLEDLGLAFVPKSFFISRDVLTADMGSYQEIDKTLAKSKFYRTISNVPRQASIGDWKTGYIQELPKENAFSELAITHVGGSQRKLRNHLAYDAAIVIIEFVRGTTSETGSAGTISLGLCLSVLSPSGYEIRTLGHK